MKLGNTCPFRFHLHFSPAIAVMKFLLSVFLLCIILPVHAEEEGHLRFLKYQADYQVNADATYSVVQEISFRLFTDAALVSSGKMPITFNSKTESAEILEAFTLKKDGRHIEVGSAGIQVQQGQLASGYGVSQADQRTLMLTFPQLEAGDAVSYKYRLTQNTPTFPGQFYAATSYARNLAWDVVNVSVELPSDRLLQFDAVKLTALPTVSHEGRTRYRWQARDLPVASTEASSVDLFASTPHLVVSTFDNWQQFAEAYQLRAKPMAQVTPEIRLLATQLGTGKSDQRAQAEALYNWVSTNIRYVATWVGSDGWVPHSATSVLANRYGDCKDHVVLLEALLAALDIPSTTVMINSDKTSYSLPPVVFPAFNHVITYIPSLDVYLDSTAGASTPFGILPIADMDKPAIHTAFASPVHRTPMLDPAHFSALRITHLTLDADGNATGDFSITASGTAAIDLREMRHAIGKHKEKDWVREQLDAKGVEGRGTVMFEDEADGSSMNVQMQVDLPNFMSFAENGTIPLLPLLTGPISFDHLRTVYQRAQRSLPYWCPAWTLEDRYEIRVPEGYELLLPKAQTLSEAGFSYESQYAFSNGLLQVVRKLSISHGALACQPDEFAAAKTTVMRIERDQRAQVVYQAVDARTARLAAAQLTSVSPVSSASSLLLLQSANTAAEINQQAK